MKYLKYILPVVFALGLYCGWDIHSRLTPDVELVDSPRMVIKTRILKVPKLIHRTKIVFKNVYVPPEGSITITPKDPTQNLEDVIEVNKKWYGLTLKPGFALSVYPIAYGLDVKLAFASRFGLGLGVLYSPRNQHVMPTLPLTYRLDRLPLVDNTEAYCAYAPFSSLNLNCGLRIGF